MSYHSMIAGYAPTSYDSREMLQSQPSARSIDRTVSPSAPVSVDPPTRSLTTITISTDGFRYDKDSRIYRSPKFALTIEGLGEIELTLVNGRIAHRNSRPAVMATAELAVEAFCAAFGRILVDFDVTRLENDIWYTLSLSRPMILLQNAIMTTTETHGRLYLYDERWTLQQAIRGGGARKCNITTWDFMMKGYRDLVALTKATELEFGIGSGMKGYVQMRHIQLITPDRRARTVSLGAGESDMKTWDYAVTSMSFKVEVE